MIGACTMALGNNGGALLANFGICSPRQGLGVSRLFLENLMIKAAEIDCALTHVVTEDAGLIKVLRSLGFSVVVGDSEKDSIVRRFPRQIGKGESLVYFQSE